MYVIQICILSFAAMELAQSSSIDVSTFLDVQGSTMMLIQIQAVSKLKNELIVEKSLSYKKMLLDLHRIDLQRKFRIGNQLPYITLLVARKFLIFFGFIAHLTSRETIS